MAGSPKKRAKKAAAEKPDKPVENSSGAPPDSWTADLTAQLMGKSPVATGAVDVGAGAEQPIAKALSSMAAADRDFMEGWWRDQMLHVERVCRERAELLAAAESHPNALFANQALSFGAMGMPRDVVARLLGLSSVDLEAYYGGEYAVGAAQAMGQVAANMLRMATSTNDRVAVKAATEFLNRRGGEEWRPPAQKLEINNPGANRGNLIDSSALSYEDRQALKAIILRATVREAAGLLPGPESDGEEAA